MLERRQREIVRMERLQGGWWSQRKIEIERDEIRMKERGDERKSVEVWSGEETDMQNEKEKKKKKGGVRGGSDREME